MSTYGNNEYTPGQPPHEGYVPPAGDPYGPAPAGTNKFFTEIRRLGWHRAQKGWLGGIATAISKHFDWDVALVRGVFIIFTLLAFPVAVLTYVVAWALLPEEHTQKIQLEELFESRFTGSQAIIILAGFAALTTNAFKIDLRFLSPALDNAVLSISPISLVALVIGLVIFFVHRTKEKEQAQPNQAQFGQVQFGQVQFGQAQPGQAQFGSAGSAYPLFQQTAPAAAEASAATDSAEAQVATGADEKLAAAAAPSGNENLRTPAGYPVTGQPIFPQPPVATPRPAMPIFAPEYAETGYYAPPTPTFQPTQFSPAPAALPAAPPIYHPGMIEHPEGHWGRGPGIAAFLGLAGVNLLWVTFLVLGRQIMLFDLSTRMLAVGFLGMCYVSAGLVLGYLAIRGRRGTWLTALTIAALAVLPILLAMIPYETFQVH